MRTVGLRKGQASEAYKQGKLQAKDLRSRTPEERKRISQMGVAKRRENAAKRKSMREQLEIILSMKANKPADKKLLKEMGIDPDDMNNQTLLVVALLNKATSGDVQAIKQVVDMVANSSGSDAQSKQSPVINIYGVNSETVEVKKTNNTEEYIDDEDEWVDYEDWEDNDEDWE